MTAMEKCKGCTRMHKVGHGVPARDDESSWAVLASAHDPGCTWVSSREGAPIVVPPAAPRKAKGGRR